MQGGKSSSAVGAAKEAVANVGASAWAGKEKTKAVVQEKVDKVKAHDPAAKASAEAKKQERIQEVEAVKQDAMRQNAAAKEHATALSYHPTPDADREARAVAVEGPGAGPAAAPRAGSIDDGRLPAGAGHAVGTLHARGTAGGRSM
ncbi:18 kDa seed maturation protein [Lolium perenne]|uniref:18 kDa seed maturation protein n=1 Tax=Lolium perenne TaxID=4522 RepID=UPI0021EA39AC|nr:11 kDa late embryogenesis abundant protein-like [Lolium perenne]